MRITRAWSLPLELYRDPADLHIGQHGTSGFGGVEYFVAHVTPESHELPHQ